MKAILALVAALALAQTSVAAPSGRTEPTSSPTAAATKAGRANGGAPAASYKLDPRGQRKAPSTGGATANSIICPEEPCSGEPWVVQEWSGWVTDYDFGQPVEEVIIVGKRWSDGWSTVCRGPDCADVLEGFYAGGSNWLVDIFIDYMDMREQEADACNGVQQMPTEEGKNAAANTTSHSPPGQRDAVANAVWAASADRLAIHQAIATSLVKAMAYGANGGFDVTFKFSDGGTAVYKGSIGPVPELVFKEGSLVQGNGVSRCPR